MIPLDYSDSNYFEIYLTSGLKEVGKQNDLKIFQTALSKAEFEELMSRLVKRDYKFFQKEYKEYNYGDVIVQNFNNTETRIVRLSTQRMMKNDKCLMVGYQKSKLTFLNVPSTTNIFDIYYVRRLIFRITNRIFINFQCNMDEDGNKTYLAYINYNHESNIDPEGINTSLRTVLEIFDAAKQPLESIC